MPEITHDSERPLPADSRSNGQVTQGQPGEVPAIIPGAGPRDTWSSASRQHYIDTGEYLPEPGPHFHALVNVPGYLPEHDVWTMETFDDAKRLLIAEMLVDAENASSESIATDLDNAAQDVNLWGEPDSAQIQYQTTRMAYSIVSCTEIDCADPS